jgi:hypothetical protein
VKKSERLLPFKEDRNGRPLSACTEENIKIICEALRTVCRVLREHPHSDPAQGQSLRMRHASATGLRDLCQRHHGQATGVDDALRVALREVLNPELVETAVTRAVARRRRDQASFLDRRGVVEKEVASIRQRIDRLIDAIGDESLPADEIKSRVRVETEERRALEAELASLGSVGKVASLDAAAIARDLRLKVADVTTLLGQRTPQARAMLRKILVGPITCSPVRRAGTRGYRFEGRVSLGTLLSGEVLTTWQAFGDGEYHG